MKKLFVLCIIFVLLVISVAVPTKYVLNGQHRELAGKNIFLRVSECLLFNANSANFQLYHGENTLFSMR